MVAGLKLRFRFNMGKNGTLGASGTDGGWPVKKAIHVSSSKELEGVIRTEGVLPRISNFSGCFFL